MTLSLRGADAERIEAFVARLSYKPGYSIKVKVPEYSLRQASVNLIFTAPLPDVRDPTVLTEVKMYWIAPPELENEAALLSAIRRCWLDFEAHEADEWLRLDGAAPFDPHRLDR